MKLLANARKLGVNLALLYLCSGGYLSKMPRISSLVRVRGLMPSRVLDSKYLRNSLARNLAPGPVRDQASSPPAACFLLLMLLVVGFVLLLLLVGHDDGNIGAKMMLFLKLFGAH